jgi:hypothetical protein
LRVRSDLKVRPAQRPQDGPFLGGQLLQPLGQPCVPAPARLADQLPALRGHGQHHLAPVGGMRRPHHQPPLLQHGDDARHGGRLHLLVLGQLAGRHRGMPVQHRERGELGVGERGQALGLPLDPQPAREAAHRNPQGRGQARVRPGLRGSHVH